MSSIVTSDKEVYIALGFKEDCEKLIKEYCEQNTLRFSHFARIWRDMNFSLIYCGRPGFADLLEFVEEVLHIAKQFLVDEYEELNVRVAGLYLLYGLYFKQPTNRYVKIRMTYSEWMSFNNLVTTLRAGNHLDALFIACKLQVSTAFLHVIAQRHYGLEKPYRKYLLGFGESINMNQFSFDKDLKKTVVDSGFMNSLQLINEKYYRAKCALPCGSGIEPENSLNLANKNIGEEMEQSYIQCMTEPNDMESKNPAADVDEDVATKHSKIRAKAFKYKKKLRTVEINDDVVNLFKKK